MSMDPEIKAEWIAELRNPEAKQGTGVLRDADGSRCCLGVLCDIAVKHGVIPEPEWSDVVPVAAEYEDWSGTVRIPASYTPPDKVVVWSGIPNCNPLINLTPELAERVRAAGSWVRVNHDTGYRSSLAGINDAGIPFAEIAQLIEDQL